MPLSHYSNHSLDEDEDQYLLLTNRQAKKLQKNKIKTVWQRCFEQLFVQLFESLF